MEPIILIGGGGHCRSCIDVIESEGRFRIEGIVDLTEKIGEDILGYKVFASDDDLGDLAREYKYFLLTIGQIGISLKRMTLFNRLIELNASFPVIISPMAYVSKHSKIGDGTIIMHHALVNANTIIGRNCIINSKSLIEHDVEIGDNVHVSTGSLINGGVKVGNNSFIGSGAVCKHSILIPPDTFVKASSLIK